LKCVYGLASLTYKHVFLASSIRRPHRRSWPESFQITPEKDIVHGVQLTSFQAKLVGTSEKLWKNHLDTIAQAYCCRLDKIEIEHEHIMRIVGHNAEIAAVKVREILRDPPSDLVTCVEEKFRWNFPHVYVCVCSSACLPVLCVCMCVCVCVRARLRTCLRACV